MSFAAIEARATAAIFGRLVNAQASFLHTAVPDPRVVGNVVFDAALSHVDEFGVVVNRPGLLMTPEVAPLAAVGDTVTLTRLDEAATALGDYQVRTVQPQAEGGMSRLTLAKV